MTRTEKGVDGAFWQASNREYPPIIPWDLSKPKALGVRVLLIKATQGLSKDWELERSYENGLANRYDAIGTYHFWEDYYTPLAQAMYYLGKVKPLVAGRRTFYVLDQERNTSAKKLWEFCEVIFGETGQYPLMYISPNSWNNLTTDGWWPTSKYKPKFVVCDVMQAQYPKPENDNGVNVSVLTLLEPWKSAGIEVAGHQFSAKNLLGVMYGSKGSKAIDLSLWTLEFVEKYKINYNPVPDPVDPGPGPEPSPEEIMGSLEVIVPTVDIKSGYGPTASFLGKLYVGARAYYFEKKVKDGAIWYRISKELWIIGKRADGTPNVK